jgi:hypothetical protein
LVGLSRNMVTGIFAGNPNSLFLDAVSMDIRNCTSHSRPKENNNDLLHPDLNHYHVLVDCDVRFFLNVESSLLGAIRAI